MSTFHKIIIAIFSWMLLLVSCQSTANYEANQHLSMEAQQELSYQLIRYMGKLPRKANHQTKFEERFNDAYRLIANGHKLEYYHKAPNGKEYFLFTRIAPSIKEKYVAIGGYVQFDADKNIVDYEEVFRTWKMTPEELAPKSLLLFDLLVKGGDLSPYYTENSGAEEYIEFPDARTSYNKKTRLWESTLEDYMEPLYRNFGEKDSQEPQTAETY
jgi:hypothetical protein